MSLRDAIRWIKDECDPTLRGWEEFYRNRWQHDKVVRSTHGVNCTGGCSWNIHVKQGVVTWEMQALDYPELQPGIPPYEPRGCQRGITFSWYLYSPLRVKHPYIRGALLDLWRAARETRDDPVDAWRSLVENPEARKRWQAARGKGGFRRIDWDTVLELMAAANIHTIKRHGPDRVVGFSPIPAMSMISFAAGSRLTQLMGGVHLSFYDWYCDLPPASPEVWGEQTDSHESADWYNAKLLAVMGSNLNMTRTPDCHFAIEAQHNGTKLWVFSPDFSQPAKHADEWVSLNAGQDGAWWMAVGHVILKEAHHDRRVEYFDKYVKQYTDAPYLVELTPVENGRHRPGKLLRANRLSQYADVEHGDWKFLMWDEADGRPRMPMGSGGFRWGSKPGQWNLLLKDGQDGAEIQPALTFLEDRDDVAMVLFDDFGQAVEIERGVPARRIATADGGSALVTTIHDLQMAHYGAPRGLPGDYPTSYDDDMPHTPAWSEKYTGMSRDMVVRFAREWIRTAELTRGQCLIIIGAGVNQWYHGNLMYRAAMNALMLCGCVGVNGGGLAHYVGQEKLAPVEPWTSIAMAKDWFSASRLQNAPSWHYVHTDQWRYERNFTDYHTVPRHQPPDSLAQGHAMDIQIRATRSGWLPFYPQFLDNPLDVARDAEAASGGDPEKAVAHVVDRLKSGDLRFAVEDPDAPEAWPRVWYIWRGNALLSSAKGQEYFQRHYLGTHDNAISPDLSEGACREVVWRPEAPRGKMDLVVDLNFRMDTSALYSDIVLPAATWYEKSDLNTTDLHSFIHPLTAAVPPCWESKSDWQIFQAIAKRFSELAETHFPEPIADLVVSPLDHDTPAEIAQPDLKDWKTGEVEPIPGRTTPHIKIVRRDYKNLYNQFISLGPIPSEKGIGVHNIRYDVADVIERHVQRAAAHEWDGRRFVSLKEDEDVCNIILALASVTNGELAHRAYQDLEKKVGLPLTQYSERSRSVRCSFKTIQAQPQRFINTPVWSGLIEDGRPYSPYTLNVEGLVPWRTLTGRQHFYLDHAMYLQFGEHLAAHKPKPLPAQYADIKFSQEVGPTKTLNYLTPHGKWHIHSTFGDNQRMTTLSRGVEPLWLNDKDALDLDINDNDWVEMHNDNGVVVTRAAVSARIPPGICIHYHAVDKTYSVPKSPIRKNRRAGATNSLTRTRLKPNLMAGGYGQFTFSPNYWGPVGCNRDTHILVRKLPELIW